MQSGSFLKRNPIPIKFQVLRLQELLSCHTMVIGMCMTHLFISDKNDEEHFQQL
ncbi:hypothetical protein POPTR_001G276104v4 [Populus trichocarpa]|uniref:Uncharacterized protein n=1 Tax=Populus trichocarpa TaxID=3694 RepID=A0ACC0TM59_POPTR|nr:hypothetical protein BDE02_01G247900 [Populus trichocarpa]KAI9402459.1 hypothetical protein POPTR_001G276104v4 [Populus trichocarpa]